jgi:predicted membrane-bound spermidine synthase
MAQSPATPSPTHSRLYLYFAVFIGGMATLAIEVSAQRLIGNVFGSSNLVWANVIGLILLYLTFGYFIGGRWADRAPHAATFYRLLVWAAFINALVPLIARPVAVTAANAVFSVNAGAAVGSFITILVLFAAPITLLGMVSPFAIRLAITDPTKSGEISGRIYAIGTLGSLLGTFTPNLILVPLLGTFMTFLTFAAILYVVALIGLYRVQGRAALRWLWMPLVIAVLAAWVLNGPLRAAASNATLLYDGESGYNYVQVQADANGYRYLYLNEGQGIHSQWHPTQYMYGRTWDFFLIAPYFNAPPYSYEQAQNGRVALIGLAAGTIARQYTYVYGAIPMDGIEIDPLIIDVGRRYFEMDMPNLTTYAEDGRYMLSQLRANGVRYSVVGIDAYRPPYIPWHLTTVEYFSEIRDTLTEDGVVVINVGRTHRDRRLVDALVATMSRVFPSVYVMDVPRAFNSIIVATRQPTRAENLAANLATLPVATDQRHLLALRDTLALGVSALVPVQPSELIFTDDRAAVDALVDSMVFDFLTSDQLDRVRPRE